MWKLANLNGNKSIAWDALYHPEEISLVKLVALFVKSSMVLAVAAMFHRPQLFPVHVEMSQSEWK
jgi:hypothetical protein